MANQNAERDENFVTTAISALNTDGKTIIRILANPITHRLKASDGTTGTDYGPKNALRDENTVPVLMGTSKNDGYTPIVTYADINGSLLIQST